MDIGFRLWEKGDDSGGDCLGCHVSVGETRGHASRGREATLTSGVIDCPIALAGRQTAEIKGLVDASSATCHVALGVYGRSTDAQIFVRHDERVIQIASNVRINLEWVEDLSKQYAPCSCPKQTVLQPRGKVRILSQYLLKREVLVSHLHTTAIGYHSASPLPTMGCKAFNGNLYTLPQLLHILSQVQLNLLLLLGVLLPQPLINNREIRTGKCRWYTGRPHENSHT